MKQMSSRCRLVALLPCSITAYFQKVLTVSSTMSLIVWLSCAISCSTAHSMAQHGEQGCRPSPHPQVGCKRSRSGGSCHDAPSKDWLSEDMSVSLDMALVSA